MIFYNGVTLSKLSIEIGCGTIIIPSLRLPGSEKTIFFSGIQSVLNKIRISCFLPDILIGLLTTLLLSPIANTNILSCISNVASCGTITAALKNCGIRILPVLPERNIRSALGKSSAKTDSAHGFIKLPF